MNTPLFIPNLSNGSPNGYYFKKFNVTTTDAVSTLLGSLTMVDGDQMSLTADVIAMSTLGTKIAKYKIEANLHCSGTTVTLDDQFSVFTSETDENLNLSINVATAGTVKLMVNGIAANTIAWQAVVNYHSHNIIGSSVVPPTIARYTGGDDFYNQSSISIDYEFNITSIGDSPISSWGVAIGTSPSPTTKYERGTTASVETLGATIQDDPLVLIGLTLQENTTYYVRAYATNAAGTTYGTDRIFLCLAAGKNDTTHKTLYTTETIGSQTWIKHNVTANKKANGDAATTYYPNNSGANEADYGLLYDWATANALAPAGWHLPTKAELGTLILSAGGKTQAGVEWAQTALQGTPEGLLDNASSYFNAPYGALGDNEWRFYARAAGNYIPADTYYDFKDILTLWSSEENVSLPTQARHAQLYGTGGNALYIDNSTYWAKTRCNSVRLVKD